MDHNSIYAETLAPDSRARCRVLGSIFCQSWSFFRSSHPIRDQASAPEQFARHNLVALSARLVPTSGAVSWEGHLLGFFSGIAIAWFNSHVKKAESTPPANVSGTMR